MRSKGAFEGPCLSGTASCPEKPPLGLTSPPGSRQRPSQLGVGPLHLQEPGFLLTTSCDPTHVHPPALSILGGEVEVGSRVASICSSTCCYARLWLPGRCQLLSLLPPPFPPPRARLWAPCSLGSGSFSLVCLPGLSRASPALSLRAAFINYEQPRCPLSPRKTLTTARLWVPAGTGLSDPVS